MRITCWTWNTNVFHNPNPKVSNSVDLEQSLEIYVAEKLTKVILINILLSKTHKPTTECLYYSEATVSGIEKNRIIYSICPQGAYGLI